MIKIEYWNDCDTLELLNQNGFRQVTYLNAVLSDPLYDVLKDEVDDEIEKVILWQRWEKRYEFKVFVPQYYVDALMMILLNDNVLIDGIVVSNIDVGVTHEDNYAVCSVSFASVYYEKSRCRMMMLAPIGSPTPGGQCFEPSIIVIDIVDELVEGAVEGIYALRDSGGYGYFSGSLRAYSEGAYSEVSIDEGEGIYVTSTDEEYYYNGVIFHRYPYLSAIDTIAGGYHIHGWAFPETFVYIYYDDLLAIDPVLASVFNESGIEIMMPQGDYLWEVESKTFSCDYGRTPAVFYETGFILLNDYDEFIVINDSQDKIYR